MKIHAAAKRVSKKAREAIIFRSPTALASIVTKEYRPLVLAAKYCVNRAGYFGGKMALLKALMDAEGHND